MRKAKVAILFTLIAYSSNAQDSLTNKSIAVYAFEDFSIFIASSSTTDSLFDHTSSYTQPTSKKRNIYVTGPLLKIVATTSIKPFFDPVGKVSFNTDSTSSLSKRNTIYQNNGNYQV